MAQIDAMQDVLLAADVGGTHARVGLIPSSWRPGSTVELLRYRDYRCAEWPSLESILRNFVDDPSAGARVSGAEARRCVLACAGYLVGDRVVSENLPWDVSLPVVAHAIGVDHLDLINDFVAMTWGVQCVEAKDRHVVRAAHTPRPDGPVLVVGPGTGLGSGVFLHTSAGGHVLRTEAGHVAFAPATAREMAIFENLAQTRDYVSIGDVLSGPGLLNVYGAMCRIDGRTARLTTPAEITHAAEKLQDASAKEAVQVFCGILGSFIGDLVLAYGATGGVFLTGSILPKILESLASGPFSTRYLNKGVMRPYLDGIPVYVVEQGRLGVMGAALWFLNSQHKGVENHILGSGRCNHEVEHEH